MISVLAVDDNEIHRYAISKVLKQGGYSVSTADCGIQALQLAAEIKPNVVLLDINLPDLSGFEVCQRLRDNPATRELAIVFHTATSANEVSRSFATQVGGDAFLTYPVDYNHLYSVISGCVARHRAA